MFRAIIFSIGEFLIAVSQVSCVILFLRSRRIRFSLLFSADLMCFGVLPVIFLCFSSMNFRVCSCSFEGFSTFTFHANPNEILPLIFLVITQAKIGSAENFQRSASFAGLENVRDIQHSLFTSSCLPDVGSAGGGKNHSSGITLADPYIILQDAL